MRRFLISTPIGTENTVVITGDLYHHMAHVLRMKMGARVLLADGAGREFVGSVSQVDDESISVAIEENLPVPDPLSGPAITLLQGLPRADKLEFILQKCTELGAAGIIPFVGARSVARVPAERLGEKLERWRRIAKEAARQSHRSSVPDISFAGGLQESLRLVDHPLKLLFWEEEKSATLKKALADMQQPRRIAVIIGPEGGLTAEEAASAVKCGFIPVSLGRRILRTETAGLAILAILQFYWGDIG